MVHCTFIDVVGIEDGGIAVAMGERGEAVVALADLPVQRLPVGDARQLDRIVRRFHRHRQRAEAAQPRTNQLDQCRLFLD